MSLEASSSKKPENITRRSAIATTGTALTALSVFGSPQAARSDTTTIRYATGGGIGPNETETLIFLPYLEKNVLKNFGRAYELQMTFTRGTPEAAQLLAAGQVDLATLSSAAFALSVIKDAVPGGLTIISDNFQEGHPGNATNAFFVKADSSIKRVEDLRGKKIAVNAFGSAIDLTCRVVLRKHGLDPRNDVEIVEIGFPNIGAAVRTGRVDAGCLVLPFMAIEEAKGGLRQLFSDADAFGPASVIFQVASTNFLKAHPAAVRAFLADYVTGLQWYYNRRNRPRALEVVSELTKSPIPVLDSYLMTSKDYYRNPNGCVFQNTIQTPIDAMVAEKFIPKSVDAAKYIDLSYLPHPCKV
ncbi:MAG TPA: ABC transporter substrate-binding protein [Candidatus Aquilonibacter sp.]